jgi:hypothetical protein
LSLGCHIGGEFRDTAAAIVNLDLVVSVDSSVGHLAGTLDVPAWIVLPRNPDWRWGFEGEDSPWYPRARLFRQKGWGDWPEVFARVAEALRERARKPRRQQIRVELGVLELIERTVREEGKDGRPEDTWAALLAAGLPQEDELAALIGEFRAALKEVADLEVEMLLVAKDPAKAAQAVGLLDRFTAAHQKKDKVQVALRDWLGATSPVVKPAPG